MTAAALGSSKPVTRVELKRVGIADFIQADEQLRDCGLLQDLAPEVAATLLASALGRRFADAGLVFQAQDRGQAVFLVLSGEARVTTVRDGTAVQVALARKGDCFGEDGLATRQAVRSLTATAVGSLDVAEFPASAVVAAVASSRRTRDYLMGLHERRRALQEEMTDFLNRW